MVVAASSAVTATRPPVPATAAMRAVRPPVATPTATAVPVSPALVESTVPQSSSLVARVPWMGRLTLRPTPVHRAPFSTRVCPRRRYRNGVQQRWCSHGWVLRVHQQAGELSVYGRLNDTLMPFCMQRRVLPLEQHVGWLRAVQGLFRNRVHGFRLPGGRRCQQPRLCGAFLAPAIAHATTAAPATLAAAELLENAGTAREHPSRPTGGGLWAA